MASLRRREIIGTPVTIAGFDAVLDRFDDAIGGGERIYVCCAPASTLVTARHDAALATSLAGADIVTADGMAVVWAARLLGEAIEERVYGPELMRRQCARAAAAGQRVWLYGGYDDEALAQLTAALERSFPRLEIAGGWSPPHRELSSAEQDEALARVNADAPDVVWIGLGSPRQEKWLHDMRPRLDAPVLCAVGAAFDFHAGRVAQAPQWMQNAGLEWLHRVSREPRRLGPRYLKTNPVFVAAVARQVWRERVRGQGVATG